MDYIASGKGDTTENCDPNLISNGNTKTALDKQIADNDKDPAEAPAESAACSSESIEDSVCEIPEQVEFTIVFNKVKHDITFAYDATVLELKAHLERICGVPQSAQKLIIKGMARDTMTLRKAGVVKGGKVMLVGSKMDDILAVKSAPKDVDEKSSSQSSKEPLCMQKNHRKVLDKGIPPDVMPGIKGVKEPLPPIPLSGMLNKHGGKVRLTFKPEQDQLWVGTKERTEKLAMTSIKSITSEPIKEHEEYHIMGLQLGATEASRYWLYWVPAQYVEAIKDAVLGVWQFF
ncbi:PREDICTED: ubiquitin domain-containing protein UBFD1-like [Papilio polytes]|uniref:ubiquitin domain-containing protein UBFD1-like n=1 Tax=Papilio polytes TaxID=76194 RepID=UPI0006763050|nr:PREDICTED: ubiquitin domain-containing protein UBFD1-like [Papilio polytes]